MDEHSTKFRLRLPVWLGACAFLVIAVFLLWGEHEAHIRGALPYLVLLACPVIHILMHGSHRGRGHSDGDRGHCDPKEKGGPR
ncbi:MAG: DUF2933 domain-containing protein [Nannocystaceae bacterium]|nr:DUF2933 domain-containing protein [Myxococcales bacterium]